jgi:hypothetical protein
MEVSSLLGNSSKSVSGFAFGIAKKEMFFA